MVWGTPIRVHRIFNSVGNIFWYEFSSKSLLGLETSVNLNLFGEDQQCSAEVLSVECDKIETYTDPSINEIPFTSDVYLTEGSSISFEQKHARESKIWLFTKLNDAEKHSDSKFGDLKCNDPPNGILCIATNTTSTRTDARTSKTNSRYFIRCLTFTNDDSCNYLSKAVITDSLIIDFNTTKEHRIDRKVITAGNGDVELKLQSATSLQHHHSICVLMIPLRRCDSSLFGYHLMLLNGSKNMIFIIIYSSILFVLNLTLLTLTVIVCIAAVWKSKLSKSFI